MRLGIHNLRAGLIVALFFAVFIPTVTHAEDASIADSITLTPTSKHLDVKAGQRVSDSFTIINSGTSSYNFKVYAKPYTVKDANYSAVFDRENEFSDAYKWLSLPSTMYHLDPGQRMSVPFELIVSPGARSGGHYGAIFAETQGATLPDGTSGITSSKAVGMLLYVNVAGSTVTSGSMKALEMPFYQPSAPLTATATVTNTGETDFVASATFAVMDIVGDVKYQASGEYPVLPKTNRDLKFTWDKSPWFGLYKVRLSTTVLGKTEAHESFVFIMPRWMIFIVLLAIILGAIDVVRRKRTTTKRKSH